MSIKYHGVPVIILSHKCSQNKERPEEFVEIKRTTNDCWPSGCCVRILTRNIMYLIDDSNGEEIKSEIRNLKIIKK